MTPLVSVVIPTFRRDELLLRCLTGVLSQEFPGPFEVVVVDDARSSTTGDIVETARRNNPGVPVQLLPGGQHGPASARNRGWQAASGAVIAFIDDDAYPADTLWLANGYQCFADRDVAGVSGRVIVPLPKRPTYFQRNVRWLESGMFLTCNAFYRRELLEAVGGFDERFTAPFREDSDLYFRVEALGGRMLQEMSAAVIHPALPGRFLQSLRLQRYSMFNALLKKKHPARYREVQPPPPYNYYTMVALLMASAAAFVRGRRGPSAVLFGMWLGLECQFFYRRQLGTSRNPRHIADTAITSLLIPPASIYWRLRGAWRFRTWFM